MEIKRIKYYESKSFNPYINLSFEEKLMSELKQGELIFYIWQNQNTVVIGKNQSAKAQCNLELMKKDYISLARRSSGGGAVYHDLGNLNFTFISSNDEFNIKKNLQVIKQALLEFGIEATFSGRNDLLVDGYKISGQAYLKTKDVSLHHGTLLVDVNLDNLSKYLRVDEDKLKNHGVKSHTQRVKNISQFNNQVTVEKIITQLKKSVTDVFNCPLSVCDITENDLCNKYFSDQWLYRIDIVGERISKRFDYGLLDINLKIINKIIVDVQINSDLMDVNIIEQIKENLINKKFNYTLLGSINLSDRIIEADLIQMLKDKLCTI
ncbi:MAG: lipoate--protein ligase [Sphaerochaetaceae bacterium]|nr:lipoate--protein ligase [Sphaerochaetaceae bacterium]